MKSSSKLLAGAVALVCAMPLAADNHEPAEKTMLAMHLVNVKMGHGQKFRAGMEAFSKCLAEADYEDSFSVWQALDRDRTRYWIVNTFNQWAEMGEEDEVSNACWEKEGMQEAVFDNIGSWDTFYASRMDDWSGDAEGYDIVKLHLFRVARGQDFRARVDEMTGQTKAANYEHRATWWNVTSAGRGTPDYFAVEHFKDFAAMDVERKGVDGVMRETMGDEKTDAFWEAFVDTLEDDNGYWNLMLARQSSLGYTPEDD